MVSVTPATPGERCAGPMVVMVETQASGQSPAIPLQETPSDTPGLDATVILEAVDEYPEDVETFVMYLIAQEDLATGDISCFWDIWRALADRLINTPWAATIADHYSTGMSLVDKILFGVPSKEGVHHWSRLQGHEADLNAFMAQLPAASPILMAYTRYLDGIGRRSLPDAFTVVASILQAGQPTDLLSNRNTVFYLESVLGRQVYGEPAGLKSDPKLRATLLYILDQLVEAGSSAAYSMRDDFVTPVPILNAAQHDAPR